MKELLSQKYSKKVEREAKKRKICVNSFLIELSDEYERTKAIKELRSG